MDATDSAEAAVLSELQDLILTAKAALEAMKAELSAKRQAEIRAKRAAEARAHLKQLADSGDFSALSREIDALKKDTELCVDLSDEIAEAGGIVGARQAEEQKAIASLRAAMSDSSDGQLRKLRAAIKSIDNFVPSIDGIDDLLREAHALEDALEELEALRKLLLKLNQRTIAELKSYTKPLQDIVDVMKSVCALLGHRAGEYKTWDQIKVIIGKTGKLSLRRRMTQLDIKKVSEADLRACAGYVEKANLEAVRDASDGAAVFYAWSQGMLNAKKSLDATMVEKDSKQDALNLSFF